MLSEIEARIGALNLEIASTVSLGPQFRIGHSYVTPDIDDKVTDGALGFEPGLSLRSAPYLMNIGTMWPERAKEARAKLLAELL